MSGIKRINNRLRVYAPSKLLTKVIFVFPLFLAVLTEFLKLPGAIKFIVDVAWISLAAMPLLRGKIRIPRHMLPYAVVVAIFAIDTFVVYLFHYQSALYYLWGFRNNFRFYVAFFAFAANFDEDDGSRCLQLLDKLFWVNVAGCLIQFLMGYEQDCIGGLFGISKGCNAYVIVYQTIVISKSVLEYMNGTERTVSCFSKSAAALFVSAIAELKFFFIIYIVILVMAMLLTSFSFRKFVFFLIGTCLIAIAAAVLGSVYSYFAGFLSFENLLQTLTQKNYASDVDMGRFSAIGVISNRFLTDWPSRIFGMGLGNCDTSTISFFNTSFSDTYIDLHYSIFSYAFMFIENGYVGLTLYVLFFVMCFFYARKQLKSNGSNPLFCQMAIIMSMTCFALIFYNSSLRTEAGFMIYLILALPFMKPSQKYIEDPVSGT